MTKEAIRDHLQKGGVFTQSLADATEIQWVDDLVAEGEAFVTEWRDGSRQVKGRYDVV
jgi:hypothetical protein